MAKLILIAGVSRSGKSTLAEKLTNKLGNCIKIDLDEFILPEDQLPRINELIDWERPETVDWFRLLDFIKGKKQGKEYIIVEGIFALSDKSLIDKSDFIVLLEIDKRTYLNRRKAETRWGNEPEWFLEHVWESHLKYHNPHKIVPNLIMNHPTATGLKKLTTKIKSL